MKRTVLTLLIQFFLLIGIVQAECVRSDNPGVSEVICNPPLTGKSVVVTCAGYDFNFYGSLVFWTSSDGGKTWTPSGAENCHGSTRCIDPDGFGGVDARCGTVSTNCRVTVTVLDASTNRPIVGATVRVGGNTYYTNSNGIATFTVSSGSHTVYVSAPGYNSVTRTINCGSCGNPISITVRLRPSQPTTTTTIPPTTTTIPCYTRITVSVSPKNTYPGNTIIISGRVWAIGPIRDPTVYIYLDGSFIGSTSTDNNGYYTFSYILPQTITAGTHTVRVESTVNPCYPGSATDTFTVVTTSCSVNVDDIIIERVDFVDPQEFCQGDTLRVKAIVTVSQTYADPALTLYFYLDGTLYDTETLTSGFGTYTVTFDRLIYTSSMDLGFHTVKVVASADCSSQTSQMSEQFRIVDCQPTTCSLTLVDKLVEKDEVEIGESFDVWVKMRMDYGHGSSYAYVTVSVEGDDDYQQTKTFYFDYPGDTDSGTFTFDTDGWEKGDYRIYVTATGEYGCSMDKTYVGSIRVYEEHEEGYEIEIKSLTVDPTEVCEGEEVRFKAKVKLVEAPHEEDVYVKWYVDDEYVGSSGSKEMEKGEVTTFTFDYTAEGLGTHEVKAKAIVNGDCDYKYETFSVKECYRLGHCLEIVGIETLNTPRSGEQVKFRVEIRNCGDYVERDVRTEVIDFGRVSYDGAFDIEPGEIEVATFTLSIPEGVTREILTFKAWNSYTSATKDYEFVVRKGFPYIDIEPEYKVYIGRKNKIEFFIENVGEVTDEFEVSVSGEASEWISNVPSKIVVRPDERVRIRATVRVPEGVKEGYYDFTVIAKGCEASATSTLHVVKPFEWPKFPTGMFIAMGRSVKDALLWLFTVLLALLPWFLLALFIIGLILLLLSLLPLVKRRRGEETSDGKTSLFDDCCESYRRLKRLMFGGSRKREERVP